MLQYIVCAYSCWSREKEIHSQNQNKSEGTIQPNVSTCTGSTDFDGMVYLC